MTPRFALLARCLGVGLLCLGLSLGCTEPGVSPLPPLVHSGGDAGTDAGTDAGADADAGTDAGADAGTEPTVDAVNSTVTVNRPGAIPADGQEVAVVTVTVLLTDGSPAVGLTVTVTVTGEGASVTQAAGATDAEGRTTAKVASTVPGMKSVMASVTDALGSKVSLTQTATVEFVEVRTVKTLAFRSTLPDGVAGVPLQGLVVEVRDGAGAVVADSTAEVTLSLGSGATASPEGLLTVSAVNGVATFADVVLKKAAGGYSFMASASGFEPVTSSVFTVAPGAVAALGFDHRLETATAGVAQDLEVTLADTYANTVTNYTGTVKLTSTDAAAALPSHTFTAANAGRFKFQGLTFRTAGPQTLTLADLAGAFSFTSSVDVSGALPTHMVFTQQPATRVSTRGALGPVKVELKDPFGNTSPVTGILVRVSVPAGAFTLSGGLQQWADGGVATFPDLSLMGHGITHLIASVAPLQMQDVSGADVQVVDDVAPAKPELTQTEGTETGLTVQWTGVGDDGVLGQATSQELRYSTSVITTDAAFDAATPVTAAVPGPPGTVQSATLSGLKPATTYHVALKVTDAHGNSARSESLAVSTADPQVTQLAFTPQPSNGTAGSELADVKVSLLDARGDVVPKASSVVTLTLTGQPGFPAVTVSAVDGVATFSGLRVDTAGTYTFTAMEDALTKGSQPFTVDPGAAAKLVLSALPASVSAGASLDVTVSVTDAYDNRLEDYAGTVHFTASDTQAVLPSDAVFAPPDGGQKTVSGLVFKTAGAQSLTATAPALTATVNTEVRASTAASLAVVASAEPVIAGQASSYEVVAHDAWGNVAKDYASTVTFASSDTRAVLPGAYTFTLLDEGRHLFSVELRTAGDQDVTVEDVADPSLTATHPYAIVPAAAAQLAFVSAPATGSVRQALADIAVAVKDLYDNTVASASADVQLALVGGTFAQGIPTRAAVDGVATFSGLSLDAEGTYQLQASADGFQDITSGDLSVSDTQAPAAAAGFSATAVSGDSIRLAWQAPGDDGVLGTAARYELRYAMSAITDATFDSATLVMGVAAPKTVGTAESFTVSGLMVGTTYHFALRTFDGADNASALANASTATTNPCDGYVCSPPASQCAEDGTSLEVYSSVCVVQGGMPTCEPGEPNLQACPGADAVCYAGACATAPHPGAGELVLSEVMHSPSAGTTEYLELTNTTSKLLDANGLVVNLVNGAGTPTTITVNHGHALLVPAGSRTVLAQSANFGTNGGVAANHAWGPDISLDSTGSITLEQGTVTVDSLTYTNAFPQTTGRAMSLASSIVGTKGSARAWYWCESTGSLSGGDRGTPGQANDDCGLNVEKPLNFCAIQSPKTFPSGSAYPTFITATESYDILSQFNSSDVTQRNTKGNDFYPRIEAQLGYGTDATNPAGWTWRAADFNAAFSPSNSNNDEMKAALRIPTAGTYSYGFRYRFTDAGAPWVYCDQNGKTVPPAGTWGTVQVAKPPLTNHVVISEVSTSSVANADDDFIELYNPTHTDIDLTGWKLMYSHAWTHWTDYTLAATVATTTPRKVIKAHGYFLFASPRFASSNPSVGVDTVWVSFVDLQLGGGNIRLGDPTSALKATTTTGVVDTLAYGTGLLVAEVSAAMAPPSGGGSIERKAVSTSGSGSMYYPLGEDALRGNAYDSNFNFADFVELFRRAPQNSASPIEFY
ncbi:lamin tail domain-containing protein [Corallococcus macrosporus]|uniref:Lamin tail domain-containing protein n=1 Tax=Corallococcus macrosporus TaxID=35 RepID=A0ABS3D556_9BACT|nr:lamin tail domain-containing protein [Corallococcus macrosporus]MBN8226156.1 lamin tail domain-containing protein [Corallococcus macrosporus]